MQVAKLAASWFTRSSRTPDRAVLESDFAEAAEAIGYAREAASAEGANRTSAVRLRFDQLKEVGPSIRVLQVSGTRLDGQEILDLFATLRSPANIGAFY